MKGFFLFFVSFSFPVLLIAQQTAEKFIQETHYLLSLPDGYKADTVKRWPLIIFLHGSGESGTDLEKVKAHGPPKHAAQGRKFPFIIASPQAEPFAEWQPENLYRLIQHIKRTQRVDPSKVYLTGLSMGGYGTWELAMKHPEEFAAIAPICGGGDTANVWKLRNTPIWCFHGAKDDVVLPEQSKRMVSAVRKYNQGVLFTLYPDANHNSWDPAYDDDSLFNWFLTKSKFTYKEISFDSASARIYNGKYIGPSRHTIVIRAGKNYLIAQDGKEIIPLRAAGKDFFFLDPSKQADIRFNQTNGKVTGFVFMGNRRTVFRKI